MPPGYVRSGPRQGNCSTDPLGYLPLSSYEVYEPGAQAAALVTSLMVSTSAIAHPANVTPATSAQRTGRERGEDILRACLPVVLPDSPSCPSPPRHTARKCYSAVRSRVASTWRLPSIR